MDKQMLVDYKGKKTKDAIQQTKTYAIPFIFGVEPMKRLLTNEQ